MIYDSVIIITKTNYFQNITSFFKIHNIKNLLKNIRKPYTLYIPRGKSLYGNIFTFNFIENLLILKLVKRFDQLFF